MIKKLFIIIFSLIISTNLYAEDLTAQQIIDKAIAANRTGLESGSAKIKLEIFNDKGEKKDRVLSAVSMKKEGLRRSKLTFLDPADVRGTTLLILEQKGADKNIQYLFLPAIKKVRKIAGSEKYNSLMGSDFTYADIESHDVKEGSYERLPDETFSGRSCYKIKVVPNNIEFYGMIDVLVDKDTYLPLKVTFYDKKKETLKVLSSTHIEKKDDINVITYMVMKNTQKGTKTNLIIEEFDLNATFEDSQFDPANLGR